MLTSAHLLQLAALLLLTMLAGVAVMQGYNARLDRIATRCRAVRERRTSSAGARGVKRSRRPLLQLVVRFGMRVINSGLLSEKTLSELRKTLTDAGMRPESTLGLFVGSKVLLLLGLPLLAWFAGSNLGLDGLWRNLLTAGAAMLGLVLPDFIVGRLRTRRREQVERGLPDALDMLIICSEAGMGIETAILRVSTELRFAHAATADELALTSSELQMTSDSHLAFTNMGERTGLESLRRLGITVVQTLQYGTPLSQALQVLAIELRTEMVTRFEERAARLPVLLTVPMIVFILPALFLVIAGPAVIQMQALQSP
jgi:tight adherence protein C